jgi:formate dehydrogenase gamma subunit
MLEKMKERKNRENNIKRFTPYRLIEHWLHAVVFGILVVTGLSQRFHTLEISQWIVLHLGGIDAARLIHRFSGFILIVLVTQHACTASLGIILRKWPVSMIIHKGDFSNAVDNLKYYFGLRNHPAQCDRYDYKQKFDYWTVLTSDILMIGTGLILWFPMAAARLFPGVFIPAANVIHTNQALLLFLMIVIWHIYNAVLSPEIFPIDMSIFTGDISRKRMVREHLLELARREGVSIKKILEHHRTATGGQKRLGSVTATDDKGEDC